MSFRKLIAGHDFIEGYWFGRAFKSKDELLNLAIISIRYKDEKIIVHGDAFLKDGEADGAFNSVFSEYEERKLKYWYEVDSSYATLQRHIEREGYCIYTFDAGNKAPQSFTGVFSPLHSVTAFRLEYVKASDELRGSTTEERYKALFELAARKKWL